MSLQNRRALLATLSALAACAPEGLDDTAEDVASSEHAVVQGSDDRSLITSAMSVAYPWRTVAAFRPTSQRTSASCTAFKVGPRHLLTAAHCFEGPDASGTYVVAATKTTVRLVFGQYGSGNDRVNMPVDERKIAVEDVYLPPDWAKSRGTNVEHDWALIRLADADSSRGWFNATARTDADVKAVTGLKVTGYPLEKVNPDGSGTDSPCAASPLKSKDCGGYQYESPAKISTMNATFFEMSADWDRGQSGGPIYSAIPNSTQKSVVALVSRNKLARNVAHRITSVIANKVCEQVRLFPSKQFPNHECGK